MADANGKPNPIKTLATSRKTIVGIVTVVCCTVVVLVGVHVKAPEAGIMTLAGAIAAIGYKTIDAIAVEDAASKAAPTAVATTGNVTVRSEAPPPIPPPPRVPS